MAEVLRAPASMSRQQRRQIERLSDDVDRVLDADRRYFERRPERRFRLRLMSAAERQQVAIIQDKPSLPIPKGEECIVAIQSVARGARLRKFVTIAAGGDLDQDDDVCRAVFEYACGNLGKAFDIIGALRTAERKRGADGPRSGAAD